MVQYHSDEAPSLLPGGQSFREQIGGVEVRVYVRSPPFVPGTALAHKVIRKAVRLLFQSRAGNSRVTQNRLIVAVDKRR